MSDSVRKETIGRFTVWCREVVILCLVLAATTMASKAQDEQSRTRSIIFTNLFNFDGANGDNPYMNLVQGSDGNLYGTTQGGGAYGPGEVFRMTPTGTLTMLYSFCAQTNCTDGGTPNGLVLATDGNFYGTTAYGGPYNCGEGCGTVFKLTPEGELTTLHSFDVTDGFFANGLAQATNGTFYGSTLVGGDGIGNLFSLSAGLRPFIETVPTSGRVGEAVTILGNDLTGTTHVWFNHTEAAFKVVSDSEIEARVPFGATGGFVIVTGRGPTTLKSNVPFQVRP